MEGRGHPQRDHGCKAGGLSGVTAGYLLGTEEKREAGPVSDADIKFALFGGDGEITDEMYEEVKNFALFIKNREREKRG